MFEVIEPHLLSPLLALVAATLYGLSAQLVRIGLNHVDARVGVSISSGTTALTYLLFAPLWLNGRDATNPGLLIFAAFGLVHPLLSRYMAYEANRRVGATISSTFESVSPLLSVLVAVVVLDERPDALVMLGTVVAVVGTLYIYWHPAVARTHMRSAILLALGAMILRSLNNVVGKIGLDFVPNPLMAGFVAYGVSWMCAAIDLRFRPSVAAAPRVGVVWFAIVGVITAIASGSLYGALMLGKVVVVAPILAGIPFFAMCIGWLIRTERLTLRNVIGVLIVLAGVVLVSLRVAQA